jgi:two-component system, chemotaxis family, sensor kinase CheA
MQKDRYRYFRIEARELLEALGRGILELERAPGDKPAVAKLLRHAHTLKGAARVVQQGEIGDLAHAAEDVLGPHRDAGTPEVAHEAIEELLRIVDAMGAKVSALGAPAPSVRPEPFDSSRFAASAQDRLGAAGAESKDPAPPARPPSTSTATSTSTSTSTSTANANANPSAAPPPSVRPEPFDSSRFAASAQDRLRAAGAESKGAAPESRGDPFDTVRVDLADMDALLDAVIESGVQATGLRRQLDRLDHAAEIARALSDQLAPRRGDGELGGPAALRLRSLADDLRRALDEAQRGLAARADRTQREIAVVRNAADRLRLVPARAIFGPLQRAVRDAARALGREVAFEPAGGEVRVDANVLGAVRDALLHVVRNAVAHGIEPPEVRARAGKPPQGKVRLEVRRSGKRVAFACHDDGAGVNLAAVRRVAAQKSLAPPDVLARFDADALCALLLRGGLSTAAEVDAVSGRGVGLDVLRDAAARLGAAVALRTEAGKGTTVEVAVPVSLSAITALLVEVAGATVAVPLDAVRETLYLEPSRIARSGEGAAIAHGGALVPFVPLERLLGRVVPPAPRRFWSALLVGEGAAVVALGADRLLGTADVIARPLPDFVEAEPTVAGAALDAEGNPHLVLDPAGLVAAATSAAAATALDAARPAERPPILVIDDSLTTRMLEQSILESAGYDVEVATSAEEALEKARLRRYGIFVVDVEMPGMDGFEFVRVTRADARLSATPAILVTSRSAPEDLRRGMESGASEYIVKGEFDQGRLLAAIRKLVG